MTTQTNEMTREEFEAEVAENFDKDDRYQIAQNLTMLATLFTTAAYAVLRGDMAQAAEMISHAVDMVGRIESVYDALGESGEDGLVN